MNSFPSFDEAWPAIDLTQPGVVPAAPPPATPATAIGQSGNLASPAAPPLPWADGQTGTLVSAAAPPPAPPVDAPAEVPVEPAAPPLFMTKAPVVEANSAVERPAKLLDPGLCLTLRPMDYPVFFEMYKAAIKNTWTVDEIDFSTDLQDLRAKMTDAERHLVQRLVAFFATGDSIVANNLVLNLYQHINAPEARMYLSRQLYEEALHVQFYLTLLDNYVPDPEERFKAFAAVESIPSIRDKAAFCMRWLNSIHAIDSLNTREHRRQFLLNLICFAACIEGLFFFGAFAYVYFLRSRGLLHGLAAGTNWVFRDESGHMAFAFEVVNTVRREEPDLFDADLEREVYEMVDEAVACEMRFAADVLQGGIAGLSPTDMRQYLEYVADQRLVTLGLAKRYGARNPFQFMDLQDVQELANFFERKVSAYQVGVSGEVTLNANF